MAHAPGLRRSTIAKLAVAATCTIALSVGGSALVVHQFSDVPNSHPFHDEISVVASAGIANGYGDGTYRPADPVSRQAMAAFLGRGLGRVGRSLDGGGSGVLVKGTDGAVPLATVTIDAGATSGSGGFVLVLGDTQAEVTKGCAGLCDINTSISSSAGGGEGTLDSASSGQIRGMHNMMVFPIDASASLTFTLSGGVSGGAGDEVNFTNREIFAVYIPFGPDGDSTLLYGD